MSIKKKVLIKVIIIISFIGIIIACQKEIEDTYVDNGSDIMESKLWYENHFSTSLDFRSTDLVKGNALGKPYWESAFSSKHKDSEQLRCH